MECGSQVPLLTKPATPIANGCARIFPDACVVRMLLSAVYCANASGARSQRSILAIRENCVPKLPP
jgi:hypothetical protein